jgi:hypothetical protein
MTALKCHLSATNALCTICWTHTFFASGPQHWATEVAVFHKITGQRLCQKACRVDIVFSMACQYRAVQCARLHLLFIDGEGHQAGLYTGTGAGCQVPAERATKDRKLSQDAQHAAAMRWRACRVPTSTKRCLSSCCLEKGTRNFCRHWVGTCFSPMGH